MKSDYYDNIGSNNIDPAEVTKFDRLAARWWDLEGDFRALHTLNPLRLDYIEHHAGLQGKRILDIGCGGGILAEGMARRGAVVTAIDAAEAPLRVAKLHRIESGIEVDYRCMTAEKLAELEAGAYDVVVCMELLEHVPNPAVTIDACAKLVKPGGDCFFSTINRNPKAWLFAIVGGEYLLRLLPKGSHDYTKFIRPSELEQWGRDAGFLLKNLQGISYNPLTDYFRLTSDVDVNYIAWMRMYALHE
uniref:Ubiquinone biosynthesis O-methyltransferase n=1 Tax=Candidatus Kentrum sp. FM TaxID=2126340 RepID=A0A450SJA5_9GAMM|nr:MAG: 2-polyprenyl-6-hydroxyphenyl methylase / 3-demethylubiquinone-9 3-methyltransferase [Candidatus Kentron sp. FM]VFJ53548.1 MAG: 2-polyprenyl-6-hydroxyphenyl methylase / 3-demethylubiquinone-9 3-methyltransferase [Candidatus Kentron sp. FM]VFK09949.1 MAG: 2-polyprenyl-6-hydroxyphenyl methylase / 3-demethylubiquinone-9 3-methyltransferase [Candidatus Kentron sp. FM]